MLTLFRCLYFARICIIQDVLLPEFASDVEPVHLAPALQSYNDDTCFTAINVRSDIPVKCTFQLIQAHLRQT